MFTCCGGPLEASVRPHDKQYLRETYEKVPVNPQYAAEHPEARMKDLSLLGGGLHGKVKLARRRSDGTLVAIKSQPIGLLHPWGARRARGEEALHRALELPHVVRMLDSATTPHKVYFVLELGQKIDPESIDTVPRAVDMMRRLLVGIKEMHSVGAYHRDIKLANALEVDGVVKITDLGKAVAPSGPLEHSYAGDDADCACKTFHKMLLGLDSQLAARFAIWWTGKPNLRVEDLEAEWLDADWMNGLATERAAANPAALASGGGPTAREEDLHPGGPVVVAGPPAPETPSGAASRAVAGPAAAKLPGAETSVAGGVAPPPALGVPPAPGPAEPQRGLDKVPGRASVWSSGTYYFRHGWQKTLAYWPLVVGPGTPKRWDPVAMGTRPQGGPQVAPPPSRRGPHRPTVVRVGRSD